MNERVPLSFLLTQNRDEEPPVEPTVPFAAIYGEAPKVVTAVLERTSVLAEPSDRYERINVRHELVLVDPAVIEWRAITSTYEGVRLAGSKALAKHRPRASSSTWRNNMSIDRENADARAQQRQESDGRALKNQADVARNLEQERTRDRIAAATRPTTSPAPKETSMPEVLKRCPACKEERPKDAFPPGQGYAMCNICRAAREAAKPPPPPEGLKLCPHCLEEKPLDGFGLNAAKPDGHQSVCKECRSKVWTAGSTAMGHQKAAKAGDAGGQLKVAISSVRTLVADLRKENDRLKAELAAITSQLEELMVAAV